MCNVKTSWEFTLFSVEYLLCASRCVFFRLGEDGRVSTVGSQQEMKNLHPRCMCRVCCINSSCIFCCGGGDVMSEWPNPPTWTWDIVTASCWVMGVTLSLSRSPPPLFRGFFYAKTRRRVNHKKCTRLPRTYNIIVRVRWCSHFLSLLLKGQTHEKDGPKKNNSGVDWPLKISCKF